MPTARERSATLVPGLEVVDAAARGDPRRRHRGARDRMAGVRRHGLGTRPATRCAGASSSTAATCCPASKLAASGFSFSSFGRGTLCPMRRRRTLARRIGLERIAPVGRRMTIASRQHSLASRPSGRLAGAGIGHLTARGRGRRARLVSASGSACSGSSRLVASSCPAPRALDRLRCGRRRGGLGRIPARAPTRAPRRPVADSLAYPRSGCPRTRADGRTDLATRSRRLGLHLRLVDRTWVDDGSIYVLLPESPRAAADVLITRIRADVAGASCRSDVRLATFPEDGLTSGAIIAAVTRRHRAVRGPDPTHGHDRRDRARRGRGASRSIDELPARRPRTR